MTIRMSFIFLAAMLLTIPAVDALAQSAASSLSAGPTQANDSPVAGSKKTPNYDNPKVAGATGDTIVKGDHSTVAQDRAATAEQRESVK